MSTRIAVIPGDGIGPAVVAEAVLVMSEVDSTVEFDVLDHVNAASFLRDGSTLSAEDMARISGASGLLLGAIGDPRVRDHRYARDVLLRLRFDLDLCVNYRPVRLPHPGLSPLRDPGRRRVDCAIVRENTEGIYTGVGGALHRGTPHEVAIDTEVSTHRGVSRVIAFAMAAATRAVCMVDKSNAVPHGGALWQRCWREAAARHPHLPTSHLYVDVAAMRMVEDPSAFDVIVTNNSYGDILSDLAARLAGGLGGAASLNLNPETGFALAEPVHGSAPDLVGADTANPIGAVLSAALLLDHLGRRPAAAAVRRAVDAAVAAGQCTPDFGGALGTKAAGKAIRARL